MDPKTTDQLDRLLADGELSGPEADAIFDRVYATVAAEEQARKRQPWRIGLWVGGGLCAAAAAVLGIRAALSGPAAVPAHDGMTARGASAPTVAPELVARCADGALDACPASSKLVFLAVGEQVGGFLSAYAEPLDPGGERIWYFSREAQSPELTGLADGTRVFDRAVALRGTHRPGRYRVHAFLAERPLAQAEMLDPNLKSPVQAHVAVDLVVTGGP